MPSQIPSVIDYRNPRDAAFRDRVRGMLLQREVVLNAKLVAMFAGGLVTSFVAPAVVTLVVIHVQQRWGSHDFFKFEAALIFVIASLTIIPLLYLVEHATRGRFFEDAVRNHGLGENVNALGMLHTASRGEYEMQTTAATWAGYLEVILFAPRTTMGAIRQWRLRRYLGELNVARASEVVHALLATGDSIHPHALLRAGESAQQFWPVLLLLTLHDWTGISKAGDRVWLLGDARRRLTTQAT
jgi:hypothetical protein